MMGISLAMGAELGRAMTYGGAGTVACVCTATATAALNATDVAGCVGWFAANNYNAATGAWPDSSGHANHGTNSGGVTKPTAGTAIGGKATVHFNGSSMAVVLPSGLAGNFTGEDQPITVIALVKLGSTATVQAVCVLTQAANNQPTIGLKTTSVGPAWEAYRRAVSGVTATTNHNTSTTGVSSVMMIDSGTEHTMYLDGAKFASDPQAANTTTLGTLDQGAIGCWFRGPTPTKDEFLNGDIGELAIYAGALTAANALAASNGMRARFGQSQQVLS